ncbi:hypothetical protein A9Q81_20740 [Gammaproteobacteria bacterium 42_54_T18]|nr:hypothetical protein A9Q81_20740 [Gammaproteobacteria bacterium 42_54_T18]
MGSESDVDKKYSWRVKVIASMVAIIIMTALRVYQLKFGWPWPVSSLGTISDFGAFGDFIGGLMNPLLQFIVIAMLFWSIQVQRQELQATRDTLDATKVELLETKEANKVQAIELEKQTKILLTQQQDGLDHIKVDQELELLKRQKTFLEKLLSNQVMSDGNSIQSILEMSNPKSVTKWFTFYDGRTKHGVLGSRINEGLQLFSTGVCGLLKCKNIPLSSALVEIRWLAEILNDLVQIEVIKKELVSSIEENIINRIEESSLSKANKVFFRNNLSNKDSK